MDNSTNTNTNNELGDEIDSSIKCRHCFDNGVIEDEIEGKYVGCPNRCRAYFAVVYGTNEEEVE